MGGPAEKVTVAATFKHRVIFADTRDLTGSWRSICTSIDDLSQNGIRQGTWKDILTLMPGNVPKIINSFPDNMIGSHVSMFATQL